MQQSLLLIEIEQIKPVYDFDLIETDNVNQMMNKADSFTRIFESLVSANFLQKGKKITPFSEEFWILDPNVPNPWNQVVNRERLDSIDVSRYYFLNSHFQCISPFSPLCLFAQPAVAG